MTVEDIKELISVADILCDSIRDTPCGCDACWISNETIYDEYEDEYICPYTKIKDKIMKQLGDKNDS